MYYSENVKRALDDFVWDLATCSGGEPNVVPIGFRKVYDDGRLLIGDMLMDVTKKNIIENGRVAIAVTDTVNKEGYMIKGSAVYMTDGPEMDAARCLAEKMFNGKLTPKGVVIVTPEQVVVTTPGPDNKKVL